MPNHAHVVVRPLGAWTLAGLLKSWKGYSARAVNKALGREGPLWQAESYDHLVRGGADLRRCVGYVLDDPRAAGMEGWAFVGTGRGGVEG